MRLSCTASREAELSSILRRELGLSAGLIRRLKWQPAALTVNGEPAHTNRLVLPGDLVAAEIDEQSDGYPAEDGPLEILYEDEYLLALDKPAGILVHPSPCRNEGTLANYLAGYYARTGQNCAVHAVTRLDRDTMGVALFAKNAFVQERFRQLLEAGGLHKTYLAAVFGCPAEVSGTIDLPVWKPPGGTLIREVDARGQRAVTDYRVQAASGGTALLVLSPRTGRTHQLRLHCLASGWPILGDPQYATPASRAFSDRAGLYTQQLAAVRLAFPHPATGKQMVLCSRKSVVRPVSTAG